MRKRSKSRFLSFLVEVLFLPRCGLLAATVQFVKNQGEPSKANKAIAVGGGLSNGTYGSTNISVIPRGVRPSNRHGLPVINFGCDRMNTAICIGEHELHFDPYGFLGPW